MAFLTYQQKALGVEFRKKLGRPDGPDPLGMNGIYQMRHCKRGYLPIKMKFYAPPPSRTEGQDAMRTAYYEAVGAWRALTAEQKGVYNTRAKRKKYSGWNLFYKEFLLS